MRWWPPAAVSMSFVPMPAMEEMVELRGRLFGFEGLEEPAVDGAPDTPGKGGMSELKVVFFFPLSPREDIIEVVGRLLSL